MDKLKFLILVFMFLFGSSCVTEEPVDEMDMHGGMHLLSSEQTGVDFSNDLQETESLNIIEYLYYYNGGGVAVGDINGDGLEDIYFTANQKPDKLYLNKGGLKFEDVTEESGILDTPAWSSGVSMDDVNGDGFLDIYVCKVSMLDTAAGYHNLLYINNGSGVFTEKSKEYGLDFRGYSTQSCFFDYDKDGDLDMYLLNHAVHSVRSYGRTELREKTDSVSGDLFFENRLKETGSFVDVTSSAGIYSSTLGYGLAVTAEDFNNDGWVDIYVGNDFHENDYLYLNTGNKSFRESISEATTHTSQFSMGVDAADMNNDGWVDIFTTDMMPYDAEVTLKSAGEDPDQIKRIKADLGFEEQNARNHFQIGHGDGTFTDIAYTTLTYATDWSWSVLLQDFDNNSFSDIFVSNGIVRRPNDMDYINYINSNTTSISYKELIDKIPAQPLSNVLYRQLERYKFTPIQESFLGPPGFSNGAAYSDLDNDGDLEIITNNINDVASIYKNNASQKANFISFTIEERGFTAKGTKIHVCTSEGNQSKTYETTKGFQSSSSHRVHFGLGNQESVDSVVIIWPDLRKEVLYSPGINKLLQLTYNPGDISNNWDSPRSISNPGFFFPVKHEENKYFDEDTEKLIPERFSYEGPALLLEDLNGDGIDDIYLGGARNQKATLLFGKADGSYDNIENADFMSDAKYEDVDVATIDFDGDGDRDLYVVSGGNDNAELNKLLEDRLYLNNGAGIFKRVPMSLPHTNGSTVSIYDFNQDGYEDLFIGASTIPGSYGLSPYSFVLKNVNGQAVDISLKERMGMIKDSKWVDIDGDGRVELVVCGHWMNILIYSFDGENFRETTSNYGLEDLKGFWNTIEFSDVDGDGDLDLLAGNSGTNTKWTSSNPVDIQLYVGDFDGNGASDPIIFYQYFGRNIPFAPLDKIAAQLPFLKKKFVSYDSYKKVSSITELIEGADDKIVESKRINEVRSMIFINDNGVFVGHPLGFEEQLSPIQDFCTGADGRIYYTGNNSAFVSQLGKSKSNSGRVLSGFNSEKNRFSKSSRLPLPAGIGGKKLGFVNGQLLVAANNDYPYIVNINDRTLN